MLDEVEVMEPESAIDDWGDFEVTLSTLSEQEKPEEEREAEPDTDEIDAKAEAMAGCLNILFTLSEQATSIISGIDFEFDEKGKAAVVEAATPVFAKHGGVLMGVFGNYIEEATLLMAVLALTYTSRKQFMKQKALVLQEREREAKRRAQHGQETTASTLS